MLASRCISLAATLQSHVTVRRTAHRRSASKRHDEPTLFQFLVLSMLLHILAIVSFGTTGRGGIGRTEELPGTLDVSLRPLAAKPGTALRLAPGAKDNATTPDRSLLSRPASRAKPPQPAAGSAPTSRPEPSAPPPVKETEPEQSVPRFNPNASEEVDRPLRPPPPERTAPPIEAAPEPLQRIAPSPIEGELAQPVEAPAQAVPSTPVLPLERIAPPEVERALSTAPELPRESVPTAPAHPLERIAPAQPRSELAAPPEPLHEAPVVPGAPIEPTAPPGAARELAPPAEPLRELPLAPGSAIGRTPAPAIERELAPAVEMPAQSVPAAPSAPLEHVRPAASDRQLAPPVEVAAPPAAVPVVPREAMPSLPAAPSMPAMPAMSAPSAPESVSPGVTPERSILAPGAQPPGRYGTPEPDEDIFKPRRDTPGAAPHIDLEAAKKRAAREIVHEGSGSRAVLPFPLPVPERKTKEAQAMEKAIKPDCRTAYAGLGLLAVPALVASAITDEGCHW
jgi:hypothetical protein